MSFRRHNDLQRWTNEFRASSNERERTSPIFRIDFNTFYYSFLVGVSQNQRSKDLRNTTDMVSNFPENFRATKNQIIGVLIYSYTRELGIQLDDKESLKNMVSSLIDVERKNLSSEGFKRVNEYAYAGFEIIESNIEFGQNPFKALEKICNLINTS